MSILPAKSKGRQQRKSQCRLQTTQRSNHHHSTLKPGNPQKAKPQHQRTRVPKKQAMRTPTCEPHQALPLQSWGQVSPLTPRSVSLLRPWATPIGLSPGADRQHSTRVSTAIASGSMNTPRKSRGGRRDSDKTSTCFRQSFGPSRVAAVAGVRARVSQLLLHRPPLVISETRSQP
jgi:hypothetical protein